MIRNLLLLSIIVASAYSLKSSKGELEDYLIERIESAKLPGFSCAIVKNDTVVYTFVYGYANVEEQKPITLDTIFIQASVSKTITTTAILNVLEKQNQSLSTLLDSPVYQYYPVSNPNFPGDNITFRQLLTHVSSVTDFWPPVLANIQPGDPNPVGEYLDSYLLPGGELYRPNVNFLKERPGEFYDYCNNCFSLLGHLVEIIYNTEFDQYCREVIYNPLGMTESSFFLRNLDVDKIATCYLYNPLTDLHIPLPQYGIPEYPAGNLRSTIGNMANFLIAFMRKGDYFGYQLLRAETVAEIERLQVPELSSWQGLGLQYKDELLVGLDRIGHSGKIFGGVTEMYHSLSTGVGVIMMANGDVADFIAWTEIFHKLFQAGEDMF